MSDDESVSSGPAFVPDFLEDGEKRPTPTYALIRVWRILLEIIAEYLNFSLSARRPSR